MHDVSKTITGSCFCGDVQFEIELPTLFCAHCHCSMCRRPHGASFVTWVGVPIQQFHVTSAENRTQTYESSELGRRQFCKRCGSQLFCWHEDSEGAIKHMDVTLASLHGPIDQTPQGHYYYDSRAEWTRVHDDLPKFGGATGTAPLSD